MRDYNTYLDEQFVGLEINIVRHDNSPTGLPTYIEAHLERAPKDKGTFAMDLGNYLYRRFGLRFQSCPEYRGRGKKTTLRFFQSWNDVEALLPNICRAVDYAPEQVRGFQQYLPNKFQSLIIQNVKRGVHPRQQEAV